ncbi:MAG: DMT family transporter [Sulfuritalea sp.]|jgi:drug/metabolite transporter (DMT)-like permease|nr:DMT family transporter [Sulfuritalea sp.]
MRHSRTMSSSSIPRAGLILLGLLSLGWGFNWPIMKVVITEIPRWIFRGDSILLASVGLFGIAWFSGHSLRVPTGRWPQLLGMATCNIVGWNMFAIYGVSLLPSGRAAILGYTMPLWSAVLSAWFLNEPLTRRRLIGLALGMSGMALLIGAEFENLGRAPMGVILMLIAAIFWAGGLVIYKRNPLPMPITALTAWQALLGGIPIALAGHALETVEWGRISFWPLFGFWYNVFIGLLFCYWAWNKLVQMVPAAVSSLGSLIIPVVGVFSGMVFLGEAPRWQDFAALVLVLTSIATVLLPARSSA